MRSGFYSSPIKIERKEVITSDYGTDRIAWKTIYNTKAKVDYVNGDRTEENREVFFTQYLKFTVRQYIKVENEDRIIYDSNKYRILSIERRGNTTQNDVIITTELIND